MSEMQVPSTTGTTGGMPVGNTAARRGPEGNTGLEQQSAQSLQTTQSSASFQSEAISITSSSSSALFEQSSQSEQLAMLVMMLIQILFGQGQDDEQESDPLTSMAGLMMLSSFSQSYQQVSYFESQSSQVSLSTTASSASAVQATPYAQAGGDATNGTTPLGNNLDVTG